MMAVGRLAALDGLRGLAILLVIIFHLVLAYPFAALTNSFYYKLGGIGWIGVDLFFVISGYLITGILLDSKGDRFYFRTFFARRTLRIFPIYYFVLFIIFGIIPFAGLFDTSELIFIKDRQIFFWTYMTNWGFVAARGAHYFNVEWLTLVHFWTLAVEEQFYLFWPLVVYLCSRRVFVALCVILLFLALGGRLAIAVLDLPQGAAYTLTPFRLDTLVVGALIAVAMRHPEAAAKPLVFAMAPWAVGIAAAIMLVIFAFRNGIWFADRWVHTIGFSILALGWGGLLVLCLPEYGGHLAKRIFTLSVLRFLGKYSYGLYVLHPFVLAHFHPEPFVRMAGPEPIAATLYIVVGLVASLVPACLSWHLLEKHFLRLKKFFEYKQDPPGS